MAKKKHQPKRKTPPKKPGLADRRALESKMWGDFLASPDSPLSQAQQIMYQAFDEPNARQRVQLATKALATSPDCADAYVLLAEHAPSPKEALELHEQGVAAGERAIGKEAFQEAVGHFWGILETRPYMRARFGLAMSLWETNRREESVTHLQEMLRLNPGDNQGVRYTLAGFLLRMDRDNDLTQLLDQFPQEGLATWPYTRALLSFRQDGDTPEARRLLQEAKKRNQHVPAYLLGRKPLPTEQPPYYSPGQESEAVMYVNGFLAGWKLTPGAIAWLRDIEIPKKAPGPGPKGPLSFIKNWLKKNLPQEEDVWQADFGQLPIWITIAGEKVRPWLILVTSPRSNLVLATNSIEEEPVPGFLWDAVVKAMQYPAAGEPHRPIELHVRSHERWESLKPHLEEIGIKLVVTEDLDHVAEAFQGLSEHLGGGKPQPGLLDVPGVGPAQAASAFDAAAFFYQQAPWKNLGDEKTIQVECGKYQSGPWYAVVMGQAGITLGVALYESLASLKGMRGSGPSQEKAARDGVATSVTFGEESDLPVSDLDAAKKHGWNVAGPDAFPHIFHKDRGMSLRPPLAWELELMEACLRAIPEFVKQPSDHAAKMEMKVPVASGELKLVLGWVDELESL